MRIFRFRRVQAGLVVMPTGSGKTVICIALFLLRVRRALILTPSQLVRTQIAELAARRLVNGEIDENAAAEWLQKYAVMEPARARQRVKFIQRYRSYVINYNLGEDMVKRYVEKRSGTDPEKCWSEFGKLLASPRLPSVLQE